MGEVTQGDQPQPSQAAGFRRTRWTLAFLIAAAALVLFVCWLAAGTRVACQVVLVTPGGAHHAGALVTDTKTCGLPSVSYFVYVLLVVGLLLLPDAKSLSVGGLRFERLTHQVEQQTREIGQLRQQVSTTIHVGTDGGMLEQLRGGVRELKGKLDQSRGSLPGNAGTRIALEAFDAIAERVDTASVTDLINAVNLGHPLLEEARRGASERLREATRVTDADAAQAVDAGEVIRTLDWDGDDSSSGEPLSSGHAGEHKVEE
jgi:hypothetical protein